MTVENCMMIPALLKLAETIPVSVRAVKNSKFAASERPAPDGSANQDNYQTILNDRPVSHHKKVVASFPAMCV